MGSRLGIVGTRRPFVGLTEKIRTILQTLEPDDVIVTGCAKGVDEAARTEGSLRGFVVIECHAPWSIGRKAGPIRNSVIVDLLDPETDRLIAIVDSESIGTWDTIRKAKQKGIPVEILRV